MRIQEPEITNFPFQGILIVERIFKFLTIRKYFLRYFFQSFKRIKQLSNEKFNHFLMYDKLSLGNFDYDLNLEKPRGRDVEGKFFSYGYQLEFADIPASVKEYLHKIKPVVEQYLGCAARVALPSLWRNEHIPDEYFGRDIFSECFHQDLVYDQYNMQLFILLHDTDETQGPFEYLDYETQIVDMEYYKKRNRIKPLSKSNKLTGKRGDTMLFSTGYTLHRAGNPNIGKQRTIMSIAFFPDYTGIGFGFAELDF